ncbi:hypothetical protein BAE46_12785 [Glaciecola punicea]|nr:hypothetical protein BAE46_12785 [Glaciecola punicea]
MALLVFIISKLPSAAFINHVQLEPKLLTALSLKAALKSAKEPHFAFIASASAPLGSPPPLGLKLFQ